MCGFPEEVVVECPGVLVEFLADFLVGFENVFPQVVPDEPDGEFGGLNLQVELESQAVADPEGLVPAGG